jgi:protein-S-isoprenylcysteine O-methyltransferase Ste14
VRNRPGRRPEGAPYLAFFWPDVGDADLNPKVLSSSSKSIPRASPYVLRPWRPRLHYTQPLNNIAAKTILGFAYLILLLAIALFAPAWTFRFWQGLLYLLIFATCSAVITLYLWRHDQALLSRRLSAGPIAEKTRVQQIIQLFASVGFLAVLIVPSLDRRFSWSHVPLWIVFAGDLLVVLGFYIVFRVFCVNTFTSATVEVTEQQTVISIGPYAFVRHPMYSGALVMLLGTPLALASWWGLVAFVLMVAVIVIRLLDEEKLLLANLSGYTEYVARVRRRLIPAIW